MSKLEYIPLTEILQKPITGSRPKGGASVEGDIPSFGGENISMFGTIKFYPVRKVSTAFFNQMRQGQLEDLDVLINKDGANTGKSAIYRNSPYLKAAINEHLFILRGIPQKVDQIYLHYLFLLPKIKDDIDKRVTGSAQPGLNVSFIRNLSVPLPPLLEQKKISTILSSVDDLIENMEGQINKLLDLKKAIINKLLTQRIDHMHEKIGYHEGEWFTVTIGDIGSFFNGLNNKISKDFGQGERFITYLQVLNQTLALKEHTGLVNIKKGEKQQKVIYGDILFTTSSETPNEVGMTSVFLEKDWSPFLNSFCFGLRPKKGFPLCPEFANHFFRGDKFRKDIRPLAQGSTRFNLSKANLKKLSVTLPCFAVQKKIANILDSMDENISKKRIRLQKIYYLKKALMQDLLTGRVRV